MTIKILIADDDSSFRGLICDIISKKRYVPIAVKNGKEAIDVFFSQIDISLCILDVMMPVYNGWEVLGEIRKHSDIPILMLTALSDEIHEVKGLSKGANDYISKPFSYPVLIARIEALLRKTKQEYEENIVTGKLTVNLASHRVSVDNNEVILNNKEFSLLNLFIKNQGIVFDRDKILDRVWGFDFDGENRTVDAHVKMLRSKLGICSDYIITVRGTGYKFEVSHEKEHSI